VLLSWEPSEESRVTGHLGPDLLGPDCDSAEALLNERNLAGIGNVYKAEVLFLRGANA
jgi:endonuclease-8